MCVDPATEALTFDVSFHNKGPVNSNRQKCAFAIHQIHKDYERLRQNFL